MTRYIIRRILQTIPVLIALSFVIFSLLELAPGDPLDLLLLDPNISTEDVDRLKALYGLDQPIPIRYVKWVGRVLQGDLGYSRAHKQPVAELLPPRIANTLTLTVFTFAWSIVFAVGIGIYSALHQYSLVDYIGTFLSFIGLAMPVFWLGLMLMMVFSVQLGWLPAGGMYSLGGEVTLLDRLRHIVMPSVVVGLLSMASWTRYTRSSVLEVVRQDYVRTARSKGLPERAVFFRHIFRNSLIPLITLVALSVPTLISGATVTEIVFSWPGMGQLLYQSVMSNDFNVTMAALMIIAVLVALSNLLADLLYAVADPRIRYT